MTSNTKENSRTFFTILDGVILCLLGISIFYLFTNGIPLHQAGWIDFPKKTNYRVAVIVFGACLLCLKVFAYPKLQQTWFFKRISTFTERQMIVGSFFLYGLYSVLYSYIGWIRHAGLQTRGFDLGIFAQAVWSTVHGRFLFSSIKDNK